MLKIDFNKIDKTSYVLILVYFAVFLFCVFTDPIYSPDTYSYLRAMPYRQLGYVIFLKVFTSLFQSYFDIAVVATHALFSLISVHFFFIRISKLFHLKILQKTLLLITLLFPFLPPLSIANNLCSEGLSYGLYLLFITIGMDILFNKKHQLFKYYIIVYLALVFVRSQFIFSTLIFAGTYFLINRTSIYHRKHLINSIIFCGVILIASLTERTYHKLKDGFFKPTPLGFTSASTAPIYLSEKDDYKYFDDEDYREIFKTSYKVLIEKDLLHKTSRTAKEDYKFFHDNLPKICNQTIKEVGVAHYFSKSVPKDWSENQAASYPFFATEDACKTYTKVLILDNFEKWIRLYYNNIVYGFKSLFLLIFVTFMFLFSAIKTLKNYTKQYAVLFLLSSLILSNAMFIAFAVHSIQRYLFYNYALIFLLFISSVNLIRREQKS
jgi:O-antigen ligase